MPGKPRGSKQYGDLVARLEQLRVHLLSFLPAPPAIRLYSDQEIDSTRAYVVLAHAEIEAFCENRALERARIAKALHTQTGEIRPILRRVLSHFLSKSLGTRAGLWIDVSNPPANALDAAFQSYQALVKGNNGIKRENLEKMLFPIGISESELSPGWLAQMSSFGTGRGLLAHSSARTQQALDPTTQLTAVNGLLKGLYDLDRRVAAIR
jgi:hypothetical protein